VRLESHVAQALEATGITGTVTKVTDYAEIARWGVMATPGLVIDGTVVIAGRVPSVDEVKQLLADATASAQ
jgi:small redox-active disulfide protein 2